MRNYDTVTEAMADLKARGFELDFNLKETQLECTQLGRKLAPEEFEITEFYRFEGNTDPGDEMVVFAIQSKDGHKGVLVNAFGAYSNTVSNELIKKLTVQHPT
jgi:hypothetical protein